MVWYGIYELCSFLCRYLIAWILIFSCIFCSMWTRGCVLFIYVVFFTLLMVPTRYKRWVIMAAMIISCRWSNVSHLVYVVYSFSRLCLGVMSSHDIRGRMQCFFFNCFSFLSFRVGLLSLLLSAFFVALFWAEFVCVIGWRYLHFLCFLLDIYQVW